MTTEDVDRLRAEVEALREAGEGLAKALEIASNYVSRLAGDYVSPEPLARWREVAEDEHPGYTHDSALREAEAFRIADNAAEDVGPPAPGEGDDYPNPEIGMEC